MAAPSSMRYVQQEGQLTFVMQGVAFITCFHCSINSQELSYYNQDG